MSRNPDSPKSTASKMFKSTTDFLWNKGVRISKQMVKDEVLEAVNKILSKANGDEEIVEYWLKVKEEIEKL